MVTKLGPEEALKTQISLIRYICRINDTEKIRIAEMHWEWWNRGYDCDEFDDALLDEYRCYSDESLCYFRGWIDKTDEDIYRELTA